MTVLSIFLQAATGSGMSSILMMVALIAIFYFFMIRPQNKKQKEIAYWEKMTIFVSPPNTRVPK